MSSNACCNTLGGPAKDIAVNTICAAKGSICELNVGRLNAAQLIGSGQFASFTAMNNFQVFNITPQVTTVVPVVNLLFSNLEDATQTHTFQPNSVNNSSTMGGLSSSGWAYTVNESGSYQIAITVSALIPRSAPATALLCAVGDASTQFPYLTLTGTGAAIAAVLEGENINTPNTEDSMSRSASAQGIIELSAGSTVGIVVTEYNVLVAQTIQIIGASLQITKVA